MTTGCNLELKDSTVVIAKFKYIMEIIGLRCAGPLAFTYSTLSHVYMDEIPSGATGRWIVGRGMMLRQ